MIFAFRLPRFPVLLDTGTQLFVARSAKSLEAAILSLRISDNDKRAIIDLNAEYFNYYPEIDVVSPGLGINRVTKRSIIELYKARTSDSAAPIRETSLSSRTLESILIEAMELTEKSLRRSRS